MVATLSKQMGLPLTQVTEGTIVSQRAFALRLIHCVLAARGIIATIKGSKSLRTK